MPEAGNLLNDEHLDQVNGGASGAVVKNIPEHLLNRNLKKEK